jgi:mono/diheme cytochrome c family protein
MNRSPRSLLTLTLLVCVLGLPTLAFAERGPKFAADAYKSICQMCHGPTGGGMWSKIGMKVKPFTDPDVVKAPDSELFNCIKNGCPQMAAYKNRFDDGQIGDLVRYVRTLQKPNQKPKKKK